MCWTLLLLCLSQAVPAASQPVGYVKTASSTQQPKAKASDAQPAETFWERTRNDPIALYTLALTVLTGALMVVAIRQDGQIRREFAATHRPRLALRRLTFDGSGKDPVPDPPRLKIELAHTEGIGPIDAQVSITIVVFTTGHITHWILLEELEKSLPQTIRVPNGGSAAIIIRLTPEANRALSSREVMIGADSIYCAGYVAYMSVRGKTSYRLGFIRRCDIEHRWFERVNDPDFEYAD